MIKYSRTIYFVIIIMLLVSCAPQKYSIKYDIDKPVHKTSQISDSKIGILIFEDNRPLVEQKGKVGFSDTLIMNDELFEKSIPSTIAETMQKHLQSYWNSNLLILDKKSNEVDLEYLEKMRNEKYDYILIGGIDHFTQMSFDEHFTARMVCSFVSGLFLPLFPVLFPVCVLTGEHQYTTEMDFNNLFLIKTDGPQIMWQGQCKTKTTENLSAIAGQEASLKFYSDNLKKNITCVCDGISLSSEIGFPNKLSLDQTKKVIDYLNRSKSLKSLKY